MITVLTGNFGSGKTEIAINLALNKQGTLIDLDLVNPYFRSRRAQAKLEEQGVKIVIPSPELSDTDLPVIVPHILGELEKGDRELVIDVGGDNVGAVVLGRFSKDLKEKMAQVFLVLNPYRPFTGDLKSATQMLNEIESASRLKISGIISNPNLGRQTQLSDVLTGHRQVEEIAKKLGLPIELLTCRADLCAEANKMFNLPILGINIYMLAPWEL